MKNLITILSFTLLFSCSQKALSDPLAEVDFQYVRGHIIVEGSLEGSKNLKFIFDTGAMAAMIDQQVAEEINLKVNSEQQVVGAGGQTITLKQSTANNLLIGGLEFQGNDFILSDFSQFKAMGSIDDGVLGQQQINQYVVEIDYDSQKLRFYDPDSYNYTGDGEVIDIGLEIGIPSIDVTYVLNDGKEVRGRALIDTGAAMAANINTPTVEENNLIEKTEKKIARKAFGGTGEFTIYEARIAGIKFGGLEFKQVPTSMSTLTSGPLSNPNYLGLIGNPIMRQFNIILDYNNSRMILEPNSNFGSPLPTNCSGLRYNFSFTDNNTIQLLEVYDNSPGSEIGMGSGDEIIEVNGKKVIDFTRDELYDIFNYPGNSVEIIWKKDGREMKSTFVTRSLI
ncbi:MAG: aspartyl protease family protein [Cyclobacteriaceae bacterium]